MDVVSKNLVLILRRVFHLPVVTEGGHADKTGHAELLAGLQ
jgi:hypothetical protein